MTKLHMPAPTPTIDRRGSGRWTRLVGTLVLLAAAYATGCAVAGVGMDRPVHGLMRLLQA